MGEVLGAGFQFGGAQAEKTEGYFSAEMFEKNILPRTEIFLFALCGSVSFTGVTEVTRSARRYCNTGATTQRGASTRGRARLKDWINQLDGL